MCNRNAKIALHALHIICLFALFGLGCALTAMGLSGDGADGTKVLLAGIILFFVTFIFVSLYKCKMQHMRLPTNYVHVLLRVSLGVSLSMLVGGGFFAVGAKLVHGSSNDKILWAFTAFAFLSLFLTFSSRSLLCILFYWFNINRPQCVAYLLERPFEHGTMIHGVPPWELCQLNNYPTHERAKAAAALLVQRLQFNYQLPC